MNKGDLQQGSASSAQVGTGRRWRAPNRYEVTTHFNGQSTVTIEGNRATGESYSEDRPALVLRRTRAHRRLERDSITRYGAGGLMAQQLSFARDIRPWVDTGALP